jgi:hypothetical protein
VFRLDHPAEEELADVEREARGQIEALRVGRGAGALRANVGGPAQQQAGALLRPDVSRREERSRLGADDDLTGVGDRLHVHGAGGARAGDHELAVELAGEEEVERAGMDADRHPQLHKARRRAKDPEPAQLTLHRRSGPGGTRRMLGLVEQQEHGVATPLDDTRAVVVGDVEQPAEAQVERVVHLFGANLALARQTLGHGREPGDVDKRERPLDLSVPSVRRLAQPADQKPRYVGPEKLVWVVLVWHGSASERRPTASAASRLIDLSQARHGPCGQPLMRTEFTGAIRVAAANQLAPPSAEPNTSPEVAPK